MLLVATESEYRDRARECIELAINSRSSSQRVMLQHIASTWLRLADAAAGERGFNAFGNGTVHHKS
jgi:hypothetical protein